MKVVQILTTKEAQAIWAGHGVDLTDKEAAEMAEQCNDNGAQLLRGLDPTGWAHRWAREEQISIEAAHSEELRESR